MTRQTTCSKSVFQKQTSSHRVGHDLVFSSTDQLFLIFTQQHTLSCLLLHLLWPFVNGPEREKHQQQSIATFRIETITVVAATEISE